MKVLALELSSPRGSIALREGDTEVFASEFANDRKHSGHFFENLQRCVNEFGPADHIVVGLGPGSYAGTRIAIAAAIGLQVATKARLNGIASVVAFPNGPEYAVIGDARRQSFFFARICDRRCVEGPELLTEAELHQRLQRIEVPIFAIEPLVQFPDASVKFPSASILARIASEPDRVMMPSPLEPIYLREPHITQPKHK